MRKALKRHEDCRRKFIGRFERYGRKTNFKGWPEVTVLLVDIKFDEGRIATDHIWMNHTKQFKGLGDLRAGDLIEFHARVREYEKGYRGRRDEFDYDSKPTEVDYKLSHPTKFTIVEKGAGAIVPVPDFKPKKVEMYVPTKRIMQPPVPKDDPQRSLVDY